MQILPPVADSSCIVLLQNVAGAGAVTFPGASWSVGANTGDVLDTTSGHKFSVFVWRVNGVAGYRVAAHQ